MVIKSAPRASCTEAVLRVPSASGKAFRSFMIESVSSVIGRWC